MTTYQQAAHWGTYAVTTRATRATRATRTTRTGDVGRDIDAVIPWPGDADPAPQLGNLPGSVTHRSRVAAPAVRRGWLDEGPGPSRHRGTGRPPGDPRAGGPGDYVRVGWDEVLDRLAAELRRVIDEHGNEAIFGGSYGWGSAGRFHHAQSQVHRFLNCLGGYTRSVNTYSTGALEVLLPRIVCPEVTVSQRSTPWVDIVEHTRVWLALGGVPAKNTAINHGGTGDHPTRPSLAAYLARGGRLIGVTPLRDDLPAGAEWLAPRPGSDTALLLALCHTLIADGLVDHAFVAGHTVGYDELAAYLLGDADGTPKDAAWAAIRCEIPAAEIVALAHALATHRSLVTATWSLQRQQHGEMAVWAVVALGALLGQVGLPGGGFGFGYGSMNSPGLGAVPFRLPTLAQGTNPVTTRIPVAAISDLLLRPGTSIPYDGGSVTFPDTRLVYWGGGNPFHHHQDLNRLRRAMARPDTIVVHDPYWTAMARHADIVIPSTTAAERDDLTGSRNGAVLVAMHAATARHEQARDDYDTFAALATRLGVGEAFTQGRTSEQWLTHLYDEWRDDLATGAIVPRGALPDGPPQVPTYEQFRALGVLELPTAPAEPLLAAFRADPSAHPLATPSGRIELASAAIAGLGLPDCPGLPTWLEPELWREAARYPLFLVANQPRTRLHSQLDHGATSQASKVASREPIRLHPTDAAARGIAAGDVVRVFNDRGHCLAGTVLDDGLRPGVAQLATGAWYDPADPAPVPLGAAGDPPYGVGGTTYDVGRGAGEATYDPLAPGNLDVHGNPNVLTADRRTSALAQATTGQLAMVEVERYDEARHGPPPAVRAFEPPS